MIKKLIIPVIILVSVIINNETFAQDTTDFSEYLEDIVEKRESNHYADSAKKSVNKGDLKMAIQYYDKAINSYSKNARIYIKRGILKAEFVEGHEYSPPGVNSIPHLLSELSDSI